MVRSLLAIAIFTFSAFAQGHPARTSAGCGPSGVQYDVKSDKTPQPIASPESGKAALYVIQYEKRDVEAFHIGAVTTRVGLDGAWQGANHGQSYLLVPVDPGEHHLCVDWQSSLEEQSKQGSAVTLTAEAGRVYYFRATVEQREKHPPAILLEAVDPAQGQFLISTSSLSKSHAKN
jgi:hypothetical protein